MLFCIGKRSADLSAWLTSGQFSVNVLSEIKPFFAACRPEPSKVRPCAHGGPGENGCFCIEGCLVTLECRRTRIRDEGDHCIIIGLVERAVFGDPEAKPLIDPRRL